MVGRCGLRGAAPGGAGPARHGPPNHVGTRSGRQRVSSTIRCARFGWAAVSAARSPNSKSDQSKPGATTVDTRLQPPVEDAPCQMPPGTSNCGRCPDNRIGPDQFLSTVRRIQDEHSQRRSGVEQKQLVRGPHPVHRREIPTFDQVVDDRDGSRGVRPPKEPTFRIQGLQAKPGGDQQPFRIRRHRCCATE